MLRVIFADGDADSRQRILMHLQQAGFEVCEAGDGATALQVIRERRPDVAVLDLMLPGKHGFSVCQEIKADPELGRMRIIVCSAKAYPADMKKARELGADAFVVKPFEPAELVEKIRSVTDPLSIPLRVKFWGTRGSIPTPGGATMRYGGNTSCVEVRHGDDIVVFDCGTGARPLGLSLVREFNGRPMNLHMFISHTHWDHIQGFPFFGPAYIPGNRINLYSLRGSDKSLEKVFTGQMDSAYFPVSMADMMARLSFVEIDGPLRVGGMNINHMYLNHPGLAIAFRVDAGGRSVTYTTDHEPYWRLLGDNDHNRQRDLEVSAFARGSDLYIREAQYTDQEYSTKRGWGHSTWADAVESAAQAGVKRLALFHHEPMHDDEDIDRIVAECRDCIRRNGMDFECFAASDNLEIIL